MSKKYFPSLFPCKKDFKHSVLQIYEDERKRYILCNDFGSDLENFWTLSSVMVNDDGELINIILEFV